MLKYFKLTKLPILSGMEPSILLLLKSKSIKFWKLSIVDKMLPEILLFLIIK